jgi:sporulation protein YlmC with PRC-barrel domain
MARTVSDLKGLTIAATDGDIGSVQDLYFDDISWTVRYLVVDTGGWLPGRQVLISPMATTGAGAHDRIPVRLTRAQVEQSPSVESDEPVNRQYELRYSRYYGYPDYWAGPYRWGATPYADEVIPTPPDLTVESVPPESGDPHLRSARDVIGYYLEATDGDLGHVDDFTVDDREWAIRYMVVDTRNWWPGKKVLVSPEWIREVSWPDSRVYVDLSREGIKSAPEFDPARPLEREYEGRLYDHHRRRRYW